MSEVSGGYGDGPGVSSEELVKELLQECGWSVKELRKAADQGKAPLLENGIGDSLRLVDFQTHSEDYRTHYVEVKSKKRPIKYGIENEFRHGFEKSQYEDYVEFASVYTDDPVYIFIHERDAGVLLRHRLRGLSIVDQVTDEEAFGTSQPMVYFRRAEFEIVTDDLGDFAKGFAQSGLIDDWDFSPFGYRPGGQSDLEDFWSDGDE